MGATWRVTLPKPWEQVLQVQWTASLGENAGKIPIAKLPNFTDLDIYNPLTLLPNGCRGGKIGVEKCTKCHFGG